jgi:hypothetical protein
MRSCPRPRLPTTAESIRSLLWQSPIPVPDALVAQLARMGSPDLLCKLARTSDPIDRSILMRAVDLADRKDAAPAASRTPDTSPDGWEAYLEAHPAEAR